MTSRASTLSVAGVLLAVLASVALLVPVPYVTEAPGLTADTLGNDISAEGEETGNPVIVIEGDAEIFPTSGELLLTTVSVTNPDSRLTLLQAFGAWFDEEDALLPRDAVYPPGKTSDEVREETAGDMTGSQTTSEIAAARAAGYDVANAEVADVAADGPSDGLLRTGDEIVEVDGQAVAGSADVVDTVRAAQPGDALELSILREGDARRVEVVTGETDGRTTLGISVQESYDLPFEVEFNLERNIGGPSAGTVFALAIYDKLTPGELTGGEIVAGTGAIDADGVVGPIGGVQQKIVSARDDGAAVFLAPADNCDEARDAAVEPGEIRVVRIATLQEAIDSLEMLAEDPDADVPTCEAT
jgi:PDZ domain-containing protein